MAIDPQPQVPVVDDIPVPPLRTEAPADFTPKADTFLASWPKMVAQFNASIGKLNALAVWIKTVATGALDSAAASDASAKASAASAGQSSGFADTSKGYRDAAKQVYDSTVVVGQAVDASAGLPPTNLPGGVLRQKPDGSGVKEWWLPVLSRVGDSMVSAGQPDSTWIPDDTRYLQSLWPELYAKIGAIGYDVMSDNSKVNNATNFSLGQANTFNAIAMGLNDVVIGVTSAGQVFDLTNATSSTNPLYNSPNNYALNDIATDGKGTFIACGNSGNFIKSTDNGATWASISMPSGTSNYNWQSIATDAKGGWIAFNNSGPSYPLLRSINNGVNWSNVIVSSAGLSGSDWFRPVYDAASNAWYAQSRTGSNVIFKSTNVGVNWTQFGTQPPFASVALNNVGPNSTTNSKMIVRGNLIICANACTYNFAGNTYYGAIVTYSLDGGATWQFLSLYNPSVGTGGFPEDIVLGGDNTLIVTDFNQPYRMWAIKNFNIPKKTPTLVGLYVSGITGNYFRAVTNNFGTWYIVTGSSYKKILPLYDPKVQFYVPKFPDQPYPFFTYVKARASL